MERLLAQDDIPERKKMKCLLELHEGRRSSYGSLVAAGSVLDLLDPCCTNDWQPEIGIKIILILLYLHISWD